MSSIQRVGAVSKDFLFTIFDAATSTPGRAWTRVKYGPGAEEYFKRRQQEILIARLKKQKLLQERKKGSRVILELTEAGKTYALKQRIISSKKQLPKGTICLVTFDIPERERRARQAFRLFLREAGFIKRQDSVWASTKDYVYDLKLLIKKLKIEQWVEVYTAKPH